jgi:anti-sigma B factor antagonist
MTVQPDQPEPVTRIALEGRLDSAHVARVEEQFTAQVAQGGRHALVDLSQVVFLASMGVRMLLGNAKSLLADGAQMVLYGASPEVTYVIEASGIGTVVPVAQSEEEALAMMSAWRM